MIRDLTESLQAFLSQPGLPTELGNADIFFDRPTDPYTPGSTALNLFLFDIRENPELRFTEPETRRVGGQVKLLRPPLRVSCTYLVTAWPVGGSQLELREHRLLSQALQLFAATPTLPPTFLTGSLVGQEPPLPVMLAQPDGLRNPAEFWAAIGNKMKPSLLLTVTVAMPIASEESFPMVITSKIDLQTSGLHEVFFRLGGMVVDSASAPVADAAVEIPGRGRSTVTGPDGRFQFSGVPAGNFTLRVTSGMIVQNKAITVPASTGNDYNVALP